MKRKMSARKKRLIKEELPSPFEKQQITHRIAVGSIKAFASKQKLKPFAKLEVENSPYIKFYKYIARVVKTPFEELDVSAIAVTPVLAEKLNGAVYEWLRCDRRLRNPHSMDFNFRMHNLQYGPRVSNEPYMKDNIVYVANNGKEYINNASSD